MNRQRHTQQNSPALAPEQTVLFSIGSDPITRTDPRDRLETITEDCYDTD
jgi:hypothetical protein